jgi:hypothetical protein
MTDSKLRNRGKGVTLVEDVIVHLKSEKEEKAQRIHEK